MTNPAPSPPPRLTPRTTAIATGCIIVVSTAMILSLTTCGIGRTPGTPPYIPPDWSETAPATSPATAPAALRALTATQPQEVAGDPISPGPEWTPTSSPRPTISRP